MYRTGLGDCFLLALPRAHAAAGRPDSYVLIDCGVYYRTPQVTDPDTEQPVSQEAWIEKIANHIKRATGGYIDVVVITHEHWDHVSGFHEDQAQHVFGSIGIGNLWLAWTEDMSDELARKLKKEGGADHETLAWAIAEMEKRRGMSNSGPFTMSGKMLGFFGAKAGAGKKYSRETRRAMDWIQSIWATANKVKPQYFRPGHQTPLPFVDPNFARVYILGPPQDEKVLKVTERKGAAYRMGIHWPAAAACFVALGVLHSADAAVDGERTREMNIPFDKRHQRTESDFAERHPRLHDSYRAPKVLTVALAEGRERDPEAGLGPGHRGRGE
jgi:hypothetical protein